MDLIALLLVSYPLSILGLLIWIMKLHIRVYSLQKDLLERERLHWRELNQNRRL
jgi:hypothetical protein